MKKVLAIAAAIMLLAGTAAVADTLSWDYTNGADGWAISTKDTVNNHPGVVSYYGDNKLYLPGYNKGPWPTDDESVAWFDVPNTQSFIYQTDVLWAGGNGIVNSGLGVSFANATKEMWLEGAQTSGYNSALLFSYKGIANQNDWVLEKDGPSGDLQVPGNAKLKIDYNYSKPGYVQAWWMIDYNNTIGGMANTWYMFGEQAVDPTLTADKIRLGGIYSWSQAYYDNTSFTFTPVPEPSSIFALASGLAGMAGIAIRRRK